MVSSQFQSNYRLLYYCKQQAIRTTFRCEFTDDVIMVQITFWLWINENIHQNGYIYPRTLQTKKIYFIIQLYDSMIKVRNCYTNKSINRNYKKFQKAAILFGMEEHQNHNLTGRRWSLGKYKAFTQNQKLKIWVDVIELIVQQKQLACRK